jgi:hypothetical protein
LPGKSRLRERRNFAAIDYSAPALPTIRLPQEAPTGAVWALAKAVHVAHLAPDSPLPTPARFTPMTSHRAVALLALGLALLPCSPALEGEAPSRPKQAQPAPKQQDTKAKGPETPIGPKWWPSEWGADDERGAANRLTPAGTLAAAKLIQKGKVYSLGRVYEHGMPLPGKRHFSLTIPGRPTGGPDGKNRGVYNGHKLSEFGNSWGLQKLAIEKLGVFFTRGVLIDVAAHRGVARMMPGEVIAARDVEGRESPGKA